MSVCGTYRLRFLSFVSVYLSMSVCLRHRVVVDVRVNEMADPAVLLRRYEREVLQLRQIVQMLTTQQQLQQQQQQCNMAPAEVRVYIYMHSQTSECLRMTGYYV